MRSTNLCQTSKQGANLDNFLPFPYVWGYIYIVPNESNAIVGKLISGIQQVGIGVPDVHRAWSWYRKAFGIDVRMFEEKAEAALMKSYTGNEVQTRHAALALHMAGGGGLEIWQFTSRTPQPAAFIPQLGDTGVFVLKVKCENATDMLKNAAGERFRCEGTSEPAQ